MPSKDTGNYVRETLQITERQHERLHTEANRRQRPPSEIAREWLDFILDTLDGVPTLPLTRPPTPPDGEPGAR